MAGPCNLSIVFAFEDDYFIGVLLSQLHQEWARLLSTLEDRTRYTHTTTFENYPFPPTATQGEKEEVAAAARAVIERRSAICLDNGIGLTTLYNQVDEGAWEDLRDLQGALDAAVCKAYGWPASVADDPEESNARLLELNREIVAGRVTYDPF